MKRYRVIAYDFDSRANLLIPIKDQWEDNVKKMHIESQKKIIEGLKLQYGKHNFDQTLLNFQDLQAKPFSIIAYHNKFLDQIRNSFVIGGYYPALTGACALGERILNYLIISLRNYYKNTPQYKKVYRKKSFDNWKTAIDTLGEWKILLQEVIIKYEELSQKRNKAIHFNHNTEFEDRNQSLEAILLLQDIIMIQFSTFGKKDWFFNVPGEFYIKKEWESNPFIKHIFIPNSVLVGPYHRVTSVMPNWVINDKSQYEKNDISDVEFIKLRKDSISKI